MQTHKLKLDHAMFGKTERKTISVTLCVLDYPEYTTMYERHGYHKAVWYSKYLGVQARAFLSDMDKDEDGDPVIYARSDASVDVIAHELTHLWGNDHPNNPVGGVLDSLLEGCTVAAPYSFFRLYDPEGFRSMARALLAAGTADS